MSSNRKGLTHKNTSFFDGYQAGELWRQLTEDEKKPFEVQAKALKLEYVAHLVLENASHLQALGFHAQEKKMTLFKAQLFHKVAWWLPMCLFARLRVELSPRSALL